MNMSVKRYTLDKRSLDTMDLFQLINQVILLTESSFNKKEEVHTLYTRHPDMDSLDKIHLLHYIHFLIKDAVINSLGSYNHLRVSKQYSKLLKRQYTENNFIDNIKVSIATELAYSILDNARTTITEVDAYTEQLTLDLIVKKA
jgi:hypothetical protein